MDCLRFLVPKVLQPTFTWPHCLLGDKPLAQEMPASPELAGSTKRRLWEIIHRQLGYFSSRYCEWFGIPCSNQSLSTTVRINPQMVRRDPFGRSPSHDFARSTGIPVPKVISYGDHPDTSHAPVSILMTRIPGRELGLVYESLPSEQQQTILQEMRNMLDTLRSWRSPWGEERICSITGGAIRSVRVPFHSIGPYETENEFNDYLIKPAHNIGFASGAAFEATVTRAKKMQMKPHRITFTHGDFQHYNVMVHNGRVSGFIDWEAAGWYPEYWDFTTTMRWVPESFWWFDFVCRLGGSRYLEELGYERALLKLTVDSWVW